MIVASQLEAIGLKVEIVLMNWPTWLDDVFNPKATAKKTTTKKAAADK